MVELSSIKKRRITTKKPPAFHKASRYPPSFRFSALTYKQSPKALSLSPQSVLVSVPTQPNPTQVNVISGDIFSLNTPPHTSSIQLIQKQHKQHAISHLEWNQKGNTLASVDETGHLALWSARNSVNDWAMIYNVDLKQPLAAFLWFNSDRQYTVDEKDVYKRNKVHGPRNPFGQLGFITITVHGEITVHYQRNGPIFSTFSTPMPNIGRREISRADAGCFGMSLAGLDDWERISHAALTLHDDGLLYLATHNASIQPKSIAIHTIRIQFPVKSDKGAIECKPITSTKLQGHSLLTDMDVTHMLFKQGASLDLVLGLGKDGSDGCIANFKLEKETMAISTSFGTIHKERTALVYQSGISIHDRFVSCMSTATGQVMVGLSDGSIHSELATTGLSKKSNSEDMVESIDPSFWTVTEPHKTLDDCIDPIVDIAVSPNGTHIVYLFASTRMGVSRITEDEMGDGFVTLMTQKLQLCLMNDVDFLDLVSELVRMHDIERVDTILNGILTRYELQCGYSGATTLTTNEPLEDISLAKLEKAFGLVMATYKRLSQKSVHFMNFTRAIQLPVILECFKSSCSTEYEHMMQLIEKDTVEDQVKLQFTTESIWSLISLSTWTCDYVKWILKEWNVLLNTKRPLSTEQNITQVPVHAVLLLHSDSRIALTKILKLLHYFVQFTSAKSFQLEHTVESSNLLQRYANTLLNDEVIAIRDTIAFLNALGEMKPNTTEVTHRWSLLLSSTLQSYTLSDIQKVTNEYKNQCAKPSIYLDTEPPYVFDVIRKKRIAKHAVTNQCVRCQQPVLPMHYLQEIHDPCSSAQWYQSIGRRCICGGTFY